MAHVVVGLGNPGPEYRDTRHNIGQRVVDHLAHQLKKAWHPDGRALVARGSWRGDTLYLVKPQSFMNVSGPAVRRVCDALGAVSEADRHMNEEGVIAGAGLDVFEREPEVHPALLELENVVLVPHLGSATHETREAMGMLCVEALRAVRHANQRFTAAGAADGRLVLRNRQFHVGNRA